MMVLAVALENWVGLGVALAIAVYLVVVLVFPERF